MTQQVYDDEPVGWNPHRAQHRAQLEMEIWVAQMQLERMVAQGADYIFI